ncbi:tumor necrosis factor receptor superfamily member 14 isoform X6 [Struthio camelus]|uniref:tumor necrosis factor receptor superfamily member 14 isoform X6 n=1 Tax=Struthio camelus TaxID=8801 RepID=UPI0036041208
MAMISIGEHFVGNLQTGNPFLSCLKIFAIFLVTQLNRADALDCGLGEYPIGAECCPMCAAGLRVFKHCTANSSTTCMPCVEDTYTDHPNGLERCKKCKLCDKGANLVPEVVCTSTKNTVCGCPLGYFCSYLGTEDCEFCQRYTVCFPGTVVKERGTKTTDNVCEACPPGTFSAANMSNSCTPWPRLKENGLVQEEEGTPSDAVCANCLPVTAIVGAVLGVVLVAVATGLIYIWQRRKRKNYVLSVQESEMDKEVHPGFLTHVSPGSADDGLSKPCGNPEGKGKWRKDGLVKDSLSDYVPLKTSVKSHDKSATDEESMKLQMFTH